jgi:glutamine amidotransferase
MVAIIDYGLGNVGSIKNMLKKIGVQSVVTSDISEISEAEKIILPGVGSFDYGMENLINSGLTEILELKVIRQATPLLGICLGMQLLTNSSEEGKLKGFGWVDAITKKFNFKDSHQKLKIPHMGWNSINIENESPLTKELPEDTRYYFVHSYYVECNNPQDIVLTSNHGIKFTAVFQQNHIFGVQFHPEKSHKHGMKILSNFCGYNNA